MAVAYPDPAQVLDMLGYTYKDKITGFKGVASACTFDLYGNVQLTLQAPQENNKLGDCYSFDVHRLDRQAVKRAMEVPAYPDMLADMDMLGYRFRDRVSGATGVGTQISFDLFGCTEFALHTGLDKDGIPVAGFWYDISRMERLPDARVMQPPPITAAKPQDHAHGPANKPRPRR